MWNLFGICLERAYHVWWQSVSSVRQCLVMSWSPCTRLGGCQEKFLQQDFWHWLSRAVVGGSPWQLNSEYINCQTEQSLLKLSKCNYEKQICHQRLLSTMNRIMCGESCGPQSWSKVVPKEHLFTIPNYTLSLQPPAGRQPDSEKNTPVAEFYPLPLFHIS